MDRRAGGKRSFRPAGPTVLPSTKSSLLAAAQGAVEDVLREAVILAILVTHPDLIERFETALETLDVSLPEHEAVRAALLRHEGREEISQAVGAAALEKLFSARHVRIAPAVRNTEDTDLAAQCVAEELAKLAARRGHAREIEDAARDMEDLADEGLTWRLSQAAEALGRAGRGDAEDKTEYEVAPNGVRISRDERNALDAILESARRGSGPEKLEPE
jgi:DNA primase